MRLTYSNADGVVWFKSQSKNDIWLEPCEMTAHDNRIAIAKLAAYEDTGYSPLGIKSLEGEWNAMRKVVDSYRKAEEEGRLVMLPCKMGDTVWWIPPASFTWLELRPYCCMIVSVTITENKKRERRKKYRIAEMLDGKTIDNVHDVDFEEFGKTVFLSREEAEAALKGETEDV